METTAPDWAAWLQAQLDERGWRQADLVRESKGLIKRDRVSKWLRGAERPTHRMAVVTANTLGTARDEVLAAAGYEADSASTTPVPPMRPEGRLDSRTPHAELARALEEVPDVALLRILLERAESGATRAPVDVDERDLRDTHNTESWPL